ncbi:hypothetical protein N0V88_007572 [Collariella sp. IMI 366227]|nr:hypothetical protein N0V88_007572 [Collariella sp. IMI 366227]
MLEITKTMKSFAAILALAASTVLGAAVIERSAEPAPHNLTLILDSDNEGNAVWRLTEENIPVHVKRRSLDNSLDARSEGLDKRGSPECHTNNRAYSDDCRILINSIQYSNSPVPNSPRNIVYATCYISWSKVFSGVQSSFWPGAYDLLGACLTGQIPELEDHNYVSGVIRDYLPNGAAECLSGRATGCS